MGIQIKEVDARGMACPQPVLCTKQALDAIETGMVVAIVDNKIAKENIIKFAQHQDCKVAVKQQAETYYIEIQKGAAAYPAVESAKPLALDSVYNTVIVITGDVLGTGADELGAVLMKSYLYTLAALDQYPTAVILLNSGVKLAVDGAQTVEHLRTLQSKGVEILACGTCLDYYHLKEKLAVGSVTNMYSVIEWMNASGKVITL
jgi:selenium metabolism protein YedF